ncbi:MAG: DUF424 domain-containing protein [Candidatus Woesearchaeota archaeon]
MMVARMHESCGKCVLAVCDENLLGKVYKENYFVLDLTGGFFGGPVVSAAELKGLFVKANVVNAVGEESVAFFVGDGVVDLSSVRRVSGVPHVQVF